MQKHFAAALLALCALLPVTARAAGEPPKAEILVFAAASLTDVLQKVGADYASERRANVKFSFGSSATLARQIEAGAAPDLFISADEEWMDYIDQRSLIAHDSRRDLLGNRLVLVSPANQPVTLRLEKGVALKAALKAALGPAGRLAVGDPASVPAGKYAKTALTSLGAWDDVATRLAPADNVRMALLYVARGEAPLGIVYLTDAKADANVRIVGEFPEGSHAPIRYPAALLPKAKVGAGGFLAYLQGAPARARFEAAGFEALANTGQSCTHETWDMSQEAALFKGNATPANAAIPKGKAPPKLAEGRVYELTLPAQDAAKTQAVPGKRRHAEGAFGGIATFSVAQGSRYRITADGPFWIDVLANGAALKATAFHGWHDCALFRKSVEYDLTAGVALTLQLSGAAKSPVRVSIVPSKLLAVPAAK